MYEFVAGRIAGCYEVFPIVRSDQRGSFVKTFHAEEYRGRGLCSEFVEDYYSVSNDKVIRGMHFQNPPFDHVKLVYCVSGTVLDVVLDLRKGSPTYGLCESFTINSKKANCVYIPKGCAHGFAVIEGPALMNYKVSTVYNHLSDTGIAWDSIDFDWPYSDPLLSDRDNTFVDLKHFNSPFVYEGSPL